MTAAVTLTALGCSFHSLSCLQFWFLMQLHKINAEFSVLHKFAKSVCGQNPLFPSAVSSQCIFVSRRCGLDAWTDEESRLSWFLLKQLFNNSVPLQLLDDQVCLNLKPKKSQKAEESKTSESLKDPATICYFGSTRVNFGPLASLTRGMTDISCSCSKCLLSW